MFRVIGAELALPIEEERPQDETPFMPGNCFDVAPLIGLSGNLLVFEAREGPELPAFQTFAVTEMEERIHEVVSGDVFSLCLQVTIGQSEERVILNGGRRRRPPLSLHKKRPCEEINLTAEEPVLERSIEREHSSVVLRRIRRTLVKVKREKGEAAVLIFLLILASGETQELKELKTMFRAEAVISQQGVQRVEFLEVRVGIDCMGEQRGDRPLSLRTSLFPAEERTDRLSAVP